MAKVGALPAPQVVLVGFMGAGKSTTGRRLAAALGRPFADSDELLEQRLGEPIASFFEREGETAFRERECELVLELLDRAEPSVIALGGGAVEIESVREALTIHCAARVDVDPETAWQRASGTARPLARDRDSFLRLYERRLELYESVAPLGVTWSETEGDHPVFVGAGALAAVGALWPCPQGRAFLIEDERAAGFHGAGLRDALEGRVEVAGHVAVAPGEQSKSLTDVERVLRAMAGAGVQRTDAVVALGGGVAGDLAGFCAATYQRGIAWVQVPTTLVAQVDSAYGGKTGVDLPEGKNYVGAFHQPAAVFTDPATLATLPAPELASGWAEVVKTALIAGGALWRDVRALPPLGEAIESHVDAVNGVVQACARTKLAVVAVDEHDTGYRASLNLGHTFAHALESATGYEGYRHGEAVALGLLVALRLSERELGLDPSVREEVHDLLEREGLPTSFAGPGTELLLEHAGRDKKRRGDRRNLVLLRAPGDVVTHVEVAQEALVAAIEALRSGS